MTGSHRLSIAAAVSLLVAVPIGASQDVQQIAEVAQKPPATTRPTEAPPSQRPAPTPRPTEGPPALKTPQAVPVLTQQERTPDSLGLRGFSVALVLGEMQGSTAADTLPAGAKRAINDMRDFLPYKNYRVLDVQWTLCCSGGVTGISGRLRGVEEDDHWFYIKLQGTVGSKLSVSFGLREPEDGEDAGPAALFSTVERERRAAELKSKRDQLEAEAGALKSRYGEQHPALVATRTQLQAVKSEIEAAERGVAKGDRKDVAPRGKGRYILESSFWMDVGETVVIGTSRLKGDKALIALLTAASRTSSSAR